MISEELCIIILSHRPNDQPQQAYLSTEVQNQRLWHQDPRPHKQSDCDGLRAITGTSRTARTVLQDLL